ncbi:MAG: hypothetical protein P9L98_04705 [Candidatus Kaelpia imicola]|nr:hypothetical protein [Candidatus Kaelpia imicola]
MKIGLLIILSLIVVFCFFAEADEYDHLYTNGYLNGRTFDYETDDWEGDEWSYENDVYMFGLIDGLFWTNYNTMIRLYPETYYPNREDIADKARQYYINTPSRKDRPIVELMLSGCN